MANDDDLDDPKHYEMIDGKRLQLPPRSVLASLVTSRLLIELSVRGIAHNLGEPVGYCLVKLPHATDAYRCRRPAISFVSFNRWPADRAVSRTADAWDVVPELAVEVISPDDLAGELVTKIHEYFLAGVRLVWVVFPTSQQIYVYNASNQVRVVPPSGMLDGGTVLPGFQLPLNRLFDAIAPASDGA